MKRQKIYALAYPHCLMLDIAGPLQVFSSTNQILGEQAYDILIASENANPIETDAGVKLVSDCAFGEIEKGSTIILPGGPGVDRVLNDPDFLTSLQNITKDQDRLISVCSGSLLFAASGLLDGKQATSHWSRKEQVEQLFPNVKWSLDQIFTKQGNVYTSAGVSTGIDLCLSILEEDQGRKITLEVARELVIFMQRTGNQSQFSHPLMIQSQSSPKVQELCNLILDDPSKPWRVRDMSAMVGMTERTLHRHFKTSLGQSPSQYVERIRLDHARQLFDAGEKSVKRIAKFSGFANEQSLRRAFISVFKITPVEYKKRFGNVA